MDTAVILDTRYDIIPLLSSKCVYKPITTNVSHTPKYRKEKIIKHNDGLLCLDHQLHFRPLVTFVKKTFSAI